MSTHFILPLGFRSAAFFISIFPLRRVLRGSYEEPERKKSDFALWAWYSRHFDRRRIVDKAYYYASCHRQGEVRDGVRRRIAQTAVEMDVDSARMDFALALTVR